MEVKITLGEISERYNWDKFCEIKGINYWCLNEGLASSGDAIELTLDEAKQIGIDLSNENQFNS